jgi:hypothetical protein
MEDPKERAAFGGMTEHEIEQLVEHVSKRVIDNFYKEVGKNVVDKVLKIIGLVAVALLTWAGFTGKIGPG